MGRASMLCIELLRKENEYRIAVVSTHYFIASAEEEKPRRAWVEAVEIPSPGNSDLYVAKFLGARQLDVRCGLLPDIVNRVSLWLYDDVVLVDIDDANHQLPLWVSFELPWDTPPDILKLEANHWDGSTWRRDTILTDHRRPIQLDTGVGLIFIDVRHASNLWKIVLKGARKTPAS